MTLPIDTAFILERKNAVVQMLVVLWSYVSKAPLFSENPSKKYWCIQMQPTSSVNAATLNYMSQPPWKLEFILFIKIFSV